MLNTLIRFTPEQDELHQRYLEKMNEHFGQFIMQESDEEKTLSLILRNLKAICAFTVLSGAPALQAKYYQHKAKQLQQKWRSKKTKSQSPQAMPMEDLQVQIQAGCAHLLLLIKFLIKNEKALKGINKEAYHTSLGYLLLLSVSFGYNLGMALEAQGKTQEVRGCVEKSKDWLVQFETAYLSDLQADFCSSLRQVLVQKLSAFDLKPSLIGDISPTAYPAAYLSPYALKKFIAHKNANAQRFGTSCERKVIHRKNSEKYFKMDLKTYALLITELGNILQQESEQLKHFFFYANHDAGTVLLLSARFNRATRQLELVNICAGNSIIQIDFLNALRKSLRKRSVSYQLRASQANVLQSDQSEAHYATMLSSMLAKVSFKTLSKADFQVKIPLFFDAYWRKEIEFDPLDDVIWFDISALGEKALMLEPSHEAIKAAFAKMYPNQAQAKRRFNFNMRKYNLVMDDKFEGNFQFYYQHAYHRTKLLLLDQKETLSYLENMHRILNDEADCEKEALDFNDMLAQFSKMRISPKRSQASKKKLEAKRQSLIQKVATTTYNDLVVSDANLDAMKEQDGKVLRRAAAGYCTLREFEFLLDHPFLHQSIDAFDVERKYTPLQLALTSGKSKRALMLLERQANISATNNKGQSAQDIYAALPADSPIKGNAKIGAYFK